MGYRRFHRAARSSAVRTITVKYDGKCACCGAPIAAGQTADYDPQRRELRHTPNAWDEGERVSLTCFHNLKNRPIDPGANAYAGDGLDQRYEDDCRDRCGL